MTQNVPQSGESPRGLIVELSTWSKIVERIEAGADAVLPVGASAKAHGNHLPMATDRLQAEWLAHHLADRTNVVVWPTLTFGFYPAFSAYPGSTSLTRKTFQSLCREVLLDILRSGVQRVLILNTGISTIFPLEDVISGMKSHADLILANVYNGSEFESTAASLTEQIRGTHADELETSIMLAIMPDQVDMTRAESWDSHELRPPFDPIDPASPGYSPSGVYGNPTLASADKGRKLLEAMLIDILAAMR